MPRRFLHALCSGVLLALAVAFAVIAPAASAQHRDLIETAERAGGFSTLLAALDAAGLTDTVRDADALTILAPTDDAFAQLPRGTVARLLRPENRDELRAILLYHVVEGRVPARTVRTLDFAPTLNGQRVTITDDHGLRINGNRVVTADVRASNGLIHVIDGVLLPPADENAARRMRTPRGDAGPAGLIRTAIDRGVPLFNRGDADACAAVYEVAALALAEDATVPAASRRALRRAAAATGSARDRAWTLRRALDDTLGALEGQAMRSADH